MSENMVAKRRQHSGLHCAIEQEPFANRRLETLDASCCCRLREVEPSSGPAYGTGFCNCNKSFDILNIHAQ